MTLMPLSYSIADGIGFGIITYALLKILSGRMDKTHIPVLMLAVVFISKYATTGILQSG
jgi:AGZA family xanthine/uracil permease-like MFS transporter